MQMPQLRQWQARLKTANFDLQMWQAGFFEKECILGGDQDFARHVACFSETTENALNDFEASTTFLLYRGQLRVQFPETLSKTFHENKQKSTYLQRFLIGIYGCYPHLISFAVNHRPW
jgi:hypothetical protein